MSTQAQAIPEAGELMAPPLLARMQHRALQVAILFAIISVILFILDPRGSMPGYLIGFILCLGVSVGGLATLMMVHLTGGRWGIVTRRLLEAASSTIPWVALLFVPIFLGRHALYPWSRAAELARDAMLRFKHPYLNTAAVGLRAILYFVLWWYFDRKLRALSLEQDRGSQRDLLVHFQNLSGIGLVIYFLSISFAGIDWLMSLMPDYYSTIWGMLMVAIQGLETFAFLIVMSVLLAEIPPFDRVFQPKRFNELGNLMLAFLMIWAYFSYSQLIVTWSGNLPAEIQWYRVRAFGGWKWVVVLLIFIHFALPFAMLLSRARKRAARRLVKVAVLLLIMTWVDVYWLVEPNYSPGRFHLTVADFVLPVALCAFWLLLFLRALRRHPLLPLNDPHLAEVWEE